MFDAQRVKNDIIAWIKKNFDCKAVIGISGGKDSSVAAALCVEALGKENVYGVLMPQGEQHDIDFSLELAAFLQIPHIVINIKDSVDAVLKTMRESGVELSRQALINTPARIRMTVLYAISADINGRVVNTCNLSEDWVGYSTKYGDSAGDFSPLSRLVVSEVKELGYSLGLPPKFIEKVPEDGLSGLSDEQNLGFTYAVLDRYIREGVCEDAVIKAKIDKLHEMNLHKLTLMPYYEYE
jgi:NAD+ synthase